MVLIRFFKIITSLHAIKLKKQSMHYPTKRYQTSAYNSSQALNLGVSSNMEKITFDSDVRGCQIKMLGKPAIGETLLAEQKLDNAVDKFAVKVVKNNETGGHLLCEYLQILSYFIARGGKICLEVSGHGRHCKHLCVGMEIPCRLVFSCLRKVRINR